MANCAPPHDWLSQPVRCRSYGGSHGRLRPRRSPIPSPHALAWHANSSAPGSCLWPYPQAERRPPRPVNLWVSASCPLSVRLVAKPPHRPATSSTGESRRSSGPTVAKQLPKLVNSSATRIMPAVGTAIVASAPIRGEALRRGRLAATALRTGEGTVIKKRRRWPLALICLGLGGVLGATAAWLAQAGKPVQLSPYPLESEAVDDSTELHSMNGSHPVDLTDDSPAHHSA